MFDLAIIGNGSISYFCAYYIAKSFPRLKIALFSQKPRESSATEAAGAMHAVFGEVEGDITSSIHERKCYELGLNSRSHWNMFITENNLKRIVTAENTCLYLQKRSSNLENRNYKFASEAAKAASCFRELTNFEIESFFSEATNKPERACELIGEFSFSAPLFLESIESILYNLSNITFFSKCEKVVEKSTNRFDVFIPNGDVIKTTKIICAAGYKSKRILDNIDFQDIFQGVGTALELSNINTAQFNKNSVRSVSRGGSQCGIHLVPRSDSVYLGAGSYAANIDTLPLARTETIRYLIDQSKKDFFGKLNIYNSFISKTYIGSRPRSIDSYPLIGPIKKHPSIFIATGTNRLGLTWAPSIAQYALSWMGYKSKNTMFDYESFFYEWRPDREFIPFGTNEECLNYYVETRSTNEFEHDLIKNPLNKESQKRIRDYGQELLTCANKKLNIKNGYSVHPDSWSIICHDG